MSLSCRNCEGTKRYNQGQCVDCFSKNHKKYYDTPRGRASKMWSLLTTRILNKNGSKKNDCYKNVKLSITRDDFISWAVPALEYWILKNDIEQASLDRIDSNKDYELGNIQILTKAENTIKRERNKNVYALDGMGWCSKCQNYLNLNLFNKELNRFNGHSVYCKEHQKELSRLKYEKQMEKFR